MAKDFSQLLDMKGYDVTIKNEVELEEEDMRSKDLVVSFGGDNTFLKAASMIKNS